MRLTKISRGYYSATTEMLVDGQPKTVTVEIYKNEETGLWEGVFEGIGVKAEYADPCKTKGKLVEAIKSIKGWKHVKGLGYCVID